MDWGFEGLEQLWLYLVSLNLLTLLVGREHEQ